MHNRNDIEAVITSFNQQSMIYEAVQSLCRQTVKPQRILIVDDGSTEEKSKRILNDLESDCEIPVPLTVIRQSNQGVSAARNAGIRKTESSFVLVLDGDDSLEPSFIEEALRLLHENETMVAASSWLQTFGVLDALVCPGGGNIAAFLPRNCCPATHMLRREAWVRCGGYDETMRSGFEDWEFFIHMLETHADSCIGIVEKPLIHYRTVPASANVKSMEKRLELMRYIIEKHSSVYKEHITDAVLGIEAVSMSRLYGWENEIIHSRLNGYRLHELSGRLIENPSYGDGGMAAAVRIVSAPDGNSLNKVL